MGFGLSLNNASHTFATTETEEPTWKELDTNSFSEAKQLRAILQTSDRSNDLARVKLTIDKMIDPSIDIEANLKKIDFIVYQIQKMLAGKPKLSDGEKIDAIRMYLYDPGAWNNYRIFSYDLDYPEGTNIDEKLIPRYLDTRKGNCVSMPILFMIIGQRMGLDITLATAPLHIFIKYTDRLTGKTINIETVSGGYPARDVWLRKNFPMTDKAIRNGVYMKPLTRKESIAIMAMTLTESFMAKQQYKKAILLCEILLQHYPQLVEAMVRMGACYARLIQQDLASKYPHPKDIPIEQRSYFEYLSDSNRQWYIAAEALGWREPTQEENETYIKQTRKAKAAMH
jgi:regulator of sirC expression with transglutaminase-like and TPR domain